MIARALASALGALALAVLGFVVARPVVVVPRREVAPPFVLRDEAGALVSNAAAYGQPYLVTFRGSRADGGDGLGAAMAELDRALGADRVRIGRFEVALTEPAAPGVGWRRLTGSATDVRALVGGGWGVRYELGAGGLTVLEERIAIVDERGVDRGLYGISEPERIAADLRLVLEEADAEGARRLLFETAHLFLCYR